MSMMNEIQSLLYENPPRIFFAAYKVLSIDAENINNYIPAFAMCFDIHKKGLYLEDLCVLSAIFVNTEYTKEYTEVCKEINKKINI